MSLVPNYYLNVPLQLLLQQKPKLLSSKNYFIAHLSPVFPKPELHRRTGTKIKKLALRNLQVLLFTKPLKGCLSLKMAHLLSLHFHLNTIDNTACCTI